MKTLDDVAQFCTKTLDDPDKVNEVRIDDILDMARVMYPDGLPVELYDEFLVAAYTLGQLHKSIGYTSDCPHPLEKQFGINMDLN